MTSVPKRPRFSRRAYQVGMAGAAVLFALFLALPFAALLISGGPSSILRGLHDPVAWPALRLSAETTVITVTLILVGGTPLAWWLAGTRWRSARWLETLLQLPVVIPPAVGGIALLLTFGRRGLLGPLFDRIGWTPAFSTAAVVMAQVFVSAPFYLHAAVRAFCRIDASLVVATRSLGASPARVFFGVVLPMAGPALIAGAAMSWARALGEFGATLMFAGNLAGKTQTLPLAIYVAVTNDLRAAQALSLVLVIVAFVVLMALRRLDRERTSGPTRKVRQT